MKRIRQARNRRLLWSLFGSLVAWQIASAVYMAIRFTCHSETVDWIRGVPGIVLLSLVGGLTLAVVDSLANLALNRSRFRARSFRTIIALKIVALVAGAMAVLLFSRVVAAAVGTSAWSDVLPSFWERMRDRQMAVVFVYVGVVAALVAFIRQMTFLVGGRVLMNLVTGKYYHPKDEERIFMFLDLRGSTSLAEQIGNEKFCLFVQDCFRDLTDSALRHQVEIYKYVGDEAILTWKVRDGLQSCNCIEVFFEFADELERKRAFYETTYGIFPEFKAGANVGVVTVLEIGVLKREIAYLSDVLNTAARIEGQCNEYGRDFLISEDLWKLVTQDKGAARFAFERLGRMKLRGKRDEMSLYGVARTPT